MIDLNELPEDNNPELHIPANNDIGDPAFYTQQSIRACDGEHAKFVAKSPNPMVTQNVGKIVAEAMDTGGHSLNVGGAAGCRTNHGTEAAKIDARTLDGTGIVGDTGGTVGNALIGLGVRMMMKLGHNLGNLTLA